MCSIYYISITYYSTIYLTTILKCRLCYSQYILAKSTYLDIFFKGEGVKYIL